MLTVPFAMMFSNELDEFQIVTEKNIHIQVNHIISVIIVQLVCMIALVDSFLFVVLFSDSSVNS